MYAYINECYMIVSSGMQENKYQGSSILPVTQNELHIYSIVRQGIGNVN